MTQNNMLSNYKNHRGFCLCEMKDGSRKVLPFNIAAQSFKAKGQVKDLLLWAPTKKFLALVRQKEEM